ncbi:hypothetical protein V2J09_001827 [Rumex salicifolius]
MSKPLIFFLFLFLHESMAATLPPIQPPQPSPFPPIDGYDVAPSPYDKDINSWCATVPHPKPCRWFMGRETQSFRPKSRAHFRRLTIQVALDRALAAQGHTWRWGRNCTSHKERAAWADCVKLYHNTIIQLNQTLQGLKTSTYSDFDVQTWLSASLTNLETCRVSSSDLNVTDFMLPHVEYNVSDLISNSLAINEGILGMDEILGYKHSSGLGFPNWVSRQDRRLLEGRRSLAAKVALFVVAKDGSGQFRSVQAAINAAAKVRGWGRKVIHVKKGVYRENIWVNPYLSDVMLVGDGLRVTIITSGRSIRSGYTTYNSATAAIDGPRFMASGISFVNTAGSEAGQAVALRSSSDFSVFFRCGIYGYQDTLFVHSQRQFYRECYIAGTIDVIFGNAAVILQSCIIRARRPISGQANVLTAQGRNDPNQNTGIVIHNSRVEAGPDLLPVVRLVRTYLGRPWRPYSRTVIAKSYIGSLVSPKGWLQWEGNKYLKTLYYAEYRNFGPGSKLERRVRWPGFHIIRRPNVVTRFTVGKFIVGRSWLPSTGVPFSLGL